MAETSRDPDECLQSIEGDRDRSASALRGFRYAFAASFFVWAAGGALVVSGCASSTSMPTFTSVSVIGTDHPKIARAKARCGDIPMPPPQFDHVPTIRTFVSYVPYGQVGVICRAHGVRGPSVFVDRGNSAAALVSQVTDGGFEMKACSWKDVANLGFVVLPDQSGGDVSQDWETCALRHEYGHLNGWAATHPDAHYEDDWL